MSEQLERALVGAALHDPENVMAVCWEHLASPDDVYDPKLRDVLVVLARMLDDSEPTDLQAVAHRCHTIGLPWASELPSAFLFALYQEAPAPAGSPFYAAQIASEAHSRRLTRVGQQLTQIAAQPDYEPAAAAAKAADLLEQVDDPDDSSTGPQALAALADSGLDRLETPTEHSWVSTGVPRLDKLIHGLRAGQLVVVAARPSIGKTTMALMLARAVAIRQRIPTLMFSLEMNRDEVFDRVLAAEARVPLDNLIEANLDDPQWTRVARSLTAVQGAPLLIDDSPNVGLPYIRSTTRRVMRRQKVGMIVIDYLGLLDIPASRSSRQEAVAEATRGVKLLAKAHSIPVVLIAQLNRNVEQRAEKDKKPQLSDLRESGAIENHADVVMLLHREEVYKPNTSRSGEMDIIVGKNRNGPTGVVDLMYSGKYARIAEPDGQTGLLDA